jgi:hypothetical protein
MAFVLIWSIDPDRNITCRSREGAIFDGADRLHLRVDGRSAYTGVSSRLFRSDIRHWREPHCRRFLEGIGDLRV